MADTEIPATTLHWANGDAEVHKVVVGPYDNNVFIVRCRVTGESVLIDAAAGGSAATEGLPGSTC